MSKQLARRCGPRAGVRAELPRRIALALASAGSLGTVAPLFEAAAQAPGGAPAGVEEVTVTGTRLQTDGMLTPTPVTTLSADELEMQSPGLLVDALASLPQFLGSQRPNEDSAFSTGAGQSFLNLRGIGTKRMLVLVDGRRIVPSSHLGGVNISLIPQAVVQRVEVVTGGASAAYGSDAVTGVTNFLLDKDYRGLDASIEAGQTSRGDGERYQVSVAGGLQMGERGHLLLAADRYETESTFGLDKRSWYQDVAELLNPNAPPQRITVPHARTRLYTYTGLIPSGPLAGTTFTEDGAPRPFINGTLVEPGAAQAQSGGDGVNPTRENELYPDSRRDGAFVYFDYDLTDTLNVYFQGIYGRSRVDYRVSELRLLPQYQAQARIFRDNAFLHPDLQAAMDAAGVTSFPFNRMSSLADWEDIEGTQNTTKSYTIGFERESRGWLLEGYFQYGNNTRKLAGYQPRLDRVYRALDAVRHPTTGEIVCNSTLTVPDDGCKPLNLFGSGNASREAIEYIFDTARGFLTTRQHYVELVASRDLFQDRSVGAVAAAAGVTYRKEELFADILPPQKGMTMPDAATVPYRGLPPQQSNAPFIFQQANMLQAEGEYDVREIFAEAQVPLVRAATSLDLNVAARYADYSGSGGIPAWKAGVDWRISDAVRLRATRSRDVRAANLGERFDRQLTDPSYDDPWIGGVNHTPVGRTVSGGNPNVDPEKSDTTTIGLVFQPTVRNGALSFSVDWYDTAINDAINTVGAQNIIDLCFNLGSFCHLVERDSPDGRITRINNIFVNLEEARVTGVDFEVIYRRPVQWLGGGDIGVRFLGARLIENSFTDQFGITVDRAGETGDSSLPEWQGNLTLSYTSGGLTVAVIERYIGDGVRNVLETEGVHIDDNSVDSSTYTNLRVSYNFETTLGTSIEIFGIAENVFDADPPLSPNPFSFFSGTRQVNGNLFDLLGRRFTVGARFRF